jgi:hypothetical protein
VGPLNPWELVLVGKSGRTRTRSKASSPISVPYALAPGGPVRTWLPRWAEVSLPLLFCVACAYGVLEVHYSNDTWIGLAAGRQIVTEPLFPTTDTFNYPLQGVKWVNQNWLSHVFFWELCDKLGRDAVVFGTWAVGVGIFVFVMLAIRLRCGSWLAALLGGSMVAIACRDWLSIRPATIQFFFLAAAWLCLSALISQGERRRWWAVGFLLPIYGLWTHAHGSFVIGFGLLGLLLVSRRWWAVGSLAVVGGLVMCSHGGLKFAFLALGLFIATWAVAVGVFRRRAPIDGLQTGALALIGVVTAVMGAVASPYGLENWTHPLVVVESEVFRQVGEWIPPFREPDRFPPVYRFWAAFAIAAASPLVALVLRLVDSERSHLQTMDRTRAPATTSVSLHMILFDSASILIGIGMAFFARRFAPVFYILATPALVTWILRIARPLADRLRVRARDALVVGAGVAAIWMGVKTFTTARHELMFDSPAYAGLDLLDRVTHNDTTPFEALDFLRRNNLSANVLTEWKVAGSIMFYVPGARVFIDGRAQQVYTEQHYLTYMGLLGVSESMSDNVTALLDQCGTNVILLPKWPLLKKLAACVGRDSRWLKVLDLPNAALFVRQGSALFQEIERAERAGQLWWPDSPEGELNRGLLWAGMAPQDLERAVTWWQSAIAQRPSLGQSGYRWISQSLAYQGRFAEAQAYFDQERTKLAAAHDDLPADTRASLLEEIQRCVNTLRERSPGHNPGGQ